MARIDTDFHELTTNGTLTKKMGMRMGVTRYIISVPPRCPWFYFPPDINKSNRLSRSTVAIVDEVSLTA